VSLNLCALYTLYVYRKDNESRGETRLQRQRKMSSCSSRSSRERCPCMRAMRGREKQPVERQTYNRACARAHTHTRPRKNTQRCTPTYTCNKRHCRNAQPKALIANLPSAQQIATPWCDEFDAACCQQYGMHRRREGKRERRKESESERKRNSAIRPWLSLARAREREIVR